MGLLQQLNLAESVSVWHDYRAGHYSDLSTKTKNGTPTATSLSKGANFDGSTSQVSIGDIGNIRAIFFSVKPNNLTGSILELINNSTYVTYAAGVLSTTGFTSSTTYVNGIAGTAISSDKSYLVCITDSADIAAATINLGEANNVFFNGNIDCFVALSVMPTATQIAQITAELQNTVWPTAPTTKSLPSLSVPRDGLVSEWLLDNISGVTAPDSSGTGNNGTLTNGGVSVQSALGKALQFDGVNDYVNVGTSATLYPTSAFTVSAWVYTYALGTLQTIVADPSGTIYHKFIRIGTSGEMYMARWLGNVNQARVANGVSTGITANKWHHIVCVYSGTETGNWTVYVNAVDKGASTVESSSSYTHTTSSIGGLTSGTQLFNGMIKNVQVWNRALSAQEAKAIYEQGKAIPFKTDFGAIQSVADVGGVIGQFIDATPFQCAETTGRWQVVTSTINGTLVKTLKNTTVGRAYIDMSKFGNTTEAAYGSWTFWLNKVDTAAFKMNIMNTTSTSDTAGNNGYSLQFSAAEGCQLMKVANGVESQLMAMNSAITAATWAKVKLTRTVAGSWSLYLNDILAVVGIGTNPVTDTTYTTAQYLVFEHFIAANTEIALSDVGGNFALTKGYFA